MRDILSRKDIEGKDMGLVIWCYEKGKWRAGYQSCSGEYYVDDHPVDIIEAGSLNEILKKLVEQQNHGT